MMTTIREARPGDASTLAVLMTELGYPTTATEMRERITQIGEQAGYRLFVSATPSGLAGMAGAIQGWYFERMGCYVRLVALVTKEEYRNQGIGKSLVRAVESWGIHLGARAIILNCGNRPERADAHRFYANLGYKAKSIGYSKDL